MSKPKHLKLNAYEIVEEQPTSHVISTVQIICEILLRELVDKNSGKNDNLGFLEKDVLQSE